MCVHQELFIYFGNQSLLVVLFAIFFPILKAIFFILFMFSCSTEVCKFDWVPFAYFCFCFQYSRSIEKNIAMISYIKEWLCLSFCIEFLIKIPFLTFRSLVHFGFILYMCRMACFHSLHVAVQFACAPR